MNNQDYKYGVIYLHFGIVSDFDEYFNRTKKPTAYLRFKQMNDLSKLNLFNYHASEKDLNKVMYQYQGVEGSEPAIYMMIVKNETESINQGIVKLRNKVAKDLMNKISEEQQIVQQLFGLNNFEDTYLESKKGEQ